MALKIIKVPAINALGKKGPEKAPNAVMEELKESYPEFDSLDLEEIHVDNSNVEEQQKLIYENACEEFETKEKVIFLGGDHSISFPIVRAFSDVFSIENSFLIVFDSHPDCMKPMKEPTHEEWLRALVEYGLKPENIALIGVRKIEKQEIEFLKKNKILFFSGIENIETIADIVTEKVRDNQVYVSIDIDVLDPAFAPAVSYPEPAGLLSKEFFYLLKKIFHLRNLKAIDIVEIVPEIDKRYENRTIKLAGKIIEEFLEKAEKRKFYK